MFTISKSGMLFLLLSNLCVLVAVAIDIRSTDSFAPPRRISEVIVHCTATPEGRDLTVEDIDRYHRQRGFDCIGYHYLVYLDGSIVPGRPVEKVGAHCLGHNPHSIGVCYVGGLTADMKPADTRTDAQRRSLDLLIAALKRQYPGISIHGHRDFAAKDCPCFDATTQYRESL
ncbi:MAG: N-acetylmuramoyl-L-alanine amidase [Clostridiales bacterium]|nr:N-acetylmuramoyl-L-alanine amidase [Clostridiales bacterium]